ncbi:MAG: Hsp70 family protein, partial [Planctomycetota bacterium]
MWCGIDFGTTNCSLSFIEERQGLILPYTHILSPHLDSKILPNVVLFSPYGEVFVGYEALEERRKRSQKGEDFYFLDYYKPYLDEPNLRQTFSLPEKKGLVVERTLFPEKPEKEDLLRATGAVFKKLLHSLPPKILKSISGFVIGVPTLFSHLAKYRIIHSLVRGGVLSSYRQAIQRVKFVPEPVAAAMVVSPQYDRESNMLVFDFGGGSLDLALLKCIPNEEGYLFPDSELALGGLPIAGHYIDQKIFHEIIQKDDRYQRFSRFLSEYDKIIHLEQVETIKKRLSYEESVEDQVGQVSFVIHQKRLEALFRPELQKIEDTILSLLARSGFRPKDIHHVVMVGGSSVIPWVQKRIELIFPHVAEKNQILFGNKGDSKEPNREFPSEERRLTTISEGLALYPYKEKKSSHFFGG